MPALFLRQSSSQTGGLDWFGGIWVGVGGLLFVGLAIWAIWWFLRLRHKRKIQEIENRYSRNSRERASTSRPSRETNNKSSDATPGTSVGPAETQDPAVHDSPRAGEQQARQGQTQQSSSQPKKRDSTAPLRDADVSPTSRASAFLGWPLLSRKNSATRSNQRKLRPSQLSAIIESPRGLPNLSPNPDQRQDSESYLMSDVRPGTAISTDNVSSISLQSSRRSPPASLKFDVAPSLAMKPEPLFSGASNLNPTPEVPETNEVAKPVPAILCSNHDDPFSSENRPSPSRNHISRSASAGSMSLGRAPVQQLPSLPSASPSTSRPGLIRRGSSQDTLSSTGTSCSSILNSVTASPQMKAMVDFSQRHPEMGLGAHIKRNEAELKNSLMPVQYAQPRQSSPSRCLQSFHGSFRKVTSTNGSIDGQALLRNSSQPRNKFEASTTAGKDEHSKSKRGLGGHRDQATDTVERQTTPGSKVSANGSPAERQKTGFSRETSQNSMISNYEQTLPEIQTPLNLDESRNPFQWEQNSIEGSSRAGSLKGSPSSRRRHRRQNCMRISVETKPAGPPSRTTSSSNMFDIKEEPLDGPDDLNRHGHEKDGSVKRPDYEFKGSDTPGWNPERDSCAPSSPTLSIAQLYFDNEQGAGNFRRRKSSMSPTKNGSRRASAVSSTVTISAFPSPGKSAPGTASRRKQGFGSGEENCQGLQNEQRDERQIPTFSLAQGYNRKNSDEELEYPTIDLHASPPRVSEEDDTTSEEATHNVTLPHRPQYPDGQTMPSPRGLSPPLKSAPTTELSSDIPSFSIQQTPLSSSIEPANTTAMNLSINKPTLVPPTKVAVESRGRLHGPREVPAQGIMKTAMQLRRNNSEARTSIDSNDSYKSRRYLHSRREMSPNGRPDLELMEHIERLNLNGDLITDGGSEKENTADETQKRGHVRNDGVDKWRQGIVKGGSLPHGSRSLRTPSPKRLNLGSVKSGTSVEGSVAGSLYDADGFLKP